MTSPAKPELPLMKETIEKVMHDNNFHLSTAFFRKLCDQALLAITEHNDRQGELAEIGVQILDAGLKLEGTALEIVIKLLAEFKTERERRLEAEKSAEESQKMLEAEHDAHMDCHRKLEEAEKDAERYRYWRKHYNTRFALVVPHGALHFDIIGSGTDLVHNYENKVDSAIDSAIQSGEGK